MKICKYILAGVCTLAFAVPGCDSRDRTDASGRTNTGTCKSGDESVGGGKAYGIRPEGGTKGLPQKALPPKTGVKQADVEWSIESVGRFMDGNVPKKPDFRAGATMEEVCRIADEIEREIQERDMGTKSACIVEYYALAECFSDVPRGKSMDWTTGSPRVEAECFEAWSNRFAVSCALLQRSIRFADSNDSVGIGIFAAARCRAMSNAIGECAAKGMERHVEVMSACLASLSNELERDDGLLRKYYDYCTKGCRTEQQAKLFLDHIAGKLGHPPRWAERLPPRTFPEVSRETPQL